MRICREERERERTHARAKAFVWFLTFFLFRPYDPKRKERDRRIGRERGVSSWWGGKDRDEEEERDREKARPRTNERVCFGDKEGGERREGDDDPLRHKS